MRRIYLDYNATTPIAPTVQEAMAPFLSEHFGNPSSNHALGRACQEAIETAREQVATLLGAEPDEIVFTSGGTESNNLALKGTLLRNWPQSGGNLIISSIEHPAITAPARYLEDLGYTLTVVGCDRHGIVDPDDVRAAFQPDTQLVSVMHANNEIGAIQPIAEIARICHERDIRFHTDAAQSVGKIRTQTEELDVDMLSIAGHKLYAPKGIGALYIRRGIPVDPVLHGAGHERGMRPGTENVPYIVALGRAAWLAARGLDENAERQMSLRERLYAQLREGVGPELTRNGDPARCLPNTLSVNFPDVAGHDMLAGAPEICASTGAACHSPTASLSGTLAAIGLPSDIAQGTIRLTLGWSTSEEEIDRSASLLLSVWDSLVK